MSGSFLAAVLDRLGLAATPGSALQLRRSQTRLRLDWIVAAMTFLAALALLGALTVNRQAGQWRDGLAGSLTIEIPAAVPDEAVAIERVVALLRAEPAVARAEPLSRDRVAGLLAPWLGNTGLSASLPVPRLVDVTLAPGARLDLPALGARLAAAAPGVSVDDHGRWLHELLRLATAAIWVALGVVAVVALTAILAVILSIRAGLALQREAIGLLHLIGAEDRFIAREFARDALLSGLRGGLAGLVPALLVLLALVVGGEAPAASGLVPRLAPGFGAYAALAAVPLAAMAACGLTAWATVMLDLRRRV